MLLLFIGFKNLISCTGLNGNHPRESCGALWNIIYTFLFFFLLFLTIPFLSHCSIQLPLLNDSVFFIFFSSLFCLFLEYCSPIIAMCHTFRYVSFPSQCVLPKDDDFSTIWFTGYPVRNSAMPLALSNSRDDGGLSTISYTNSAW